MQWTVEQIIAELAHLDAQMLSFIERCRDCKRVEKRTLKRAKKWVMANTEMQAEVFRFLKEANPELEDAIRGEQNARHGQPMSPAATRAAVDRMAG